MPSDGAPSDPESADGSPLVEVVRARGHEHVAATHDSTLEVTTDDYLTPAGDCIVGIDADRAPADFDDAFVAACRAPDARIEVTLTVQDVPAGDGPAASDGGSPGVGELPLRDRIVGRGDPDLSFADERSLVCRTSDYVDERTVLVDADRAATDLDRDLVAALAAGAPLECRLAVE